jgi:hypothetical protein
MVLRKNAKPFYTAVKQDFVEEISDPARPSGTLGIFKAESLGIVRLHSGKLWSAISHHQFSALVNLALATAMPEFTPGMKCYKALISARRKRH